MVRELGLPKVLDLAQEGGLVQTINKDLEFDRCLDIRRELMRTLARKHIGDLFPRTWTTLCKKILGYEPAPDVWPTRGQIAALRGREAGAPRAGISCAWGVPPHRIAE